MINQRNRKVDIFQAFKEYFTGIFDFRGFTTREGYWKAVIMLTGVQTLFTLIIFKVSLALAMFLLLLFGIVVVICSMCMCVRRMRDICMSTKGIWTYYIVTFVLAFFFTQGEVSMTIVQGILSISGLLIALLPTNGLLKYKDTAFGQWFVDPTLENITPVSEN